MRRIERAYQFDVFRFDGIAICTAYSRPRLRHRHTILTGLLLLPESGPRLGDPGSLRSADYSLSPAVAGEDPSEVPALRPYPFFAIPLGWGALSAGPWYVTTFSPDDDPPQPGVTTAARHSPNTSTTYFSIFRSFDRVKKEGAGQPLLDRLLPITSSFMNNTSRQDYEPPSINWACVTKSSDRTKVAWVIGCGYFRNSACPSMYNTFDPPGTWLKPAIISWP